jgi:hypothetical protein
MSEQKRPTEEPVKRTKMTDDTQASSNEAQQSPANSGDPRTSNAVGVPLPYGGSSDNLHPITQPQGDVEDPNNIPNVRREDREKKSA